LNSSLEPGKSHVYTKEGAFAISSSWKRNTRKIVCDSTAGKALLLNTYSFGRNRKTYWFEPLVDTIDGKSFDPKFFPDFNQEGAHFDLLPETTTVCGYEVVHMKGVFDNGLTCDFWVAPGLMILPYPVFTLPDGQTGTVIESAMSLGTSNTVYFRMIEHEVLESVNETVFSMEASKGYKPLEE
jgi:hypothetical protein